MKLSKTLFIFIIILCISSDTFAQCNPYLDIPGVTSDTFCQGRLISFISASPGYSTTVSWDFGDGSTSTDLNVNHIFGKKGTYNIKFSGTGTAGSCTENLTVVIKPSPQIKISLATNDTQCFKNNYFCIVDSTLPVTKVVRQTYIFSNGLRIDTIQPVFPVNLCVFISDPTGGIFDLIVESEDKNGCVVREVLKDYIYVHPKVGVQFLNTTTAPNPGCETTLGTYKNNSTIKLADIDSFFWDFGDGVIQKGTTDSTHLWANTNHLYSTHGTFDVKLTVYPTFGCTETYKWDDAITNISITPKITHFPAGEIFANDNPISFDIANFYNQSAVQLLQWNFGEPSTGPDNFDNQSLTPKHNFALGPKLVSLRLVVGPCDITVYDTLQIIGPKAQIEIPYNRISFEEKYQCGTSDTVHFTNNSIYYHNDNNASDEDSIVTVNGQKRFAFNKTDQTSLASASHQALRTMGSQVWRVWDFGDKYAPQCTTSSSKGLNVGLNCNFSEDEYPTHKYSNWDSIYYRNYYLTNKKFEFTKYNENTKTCYIDKIDTASPRVHRKIFDKTVATKYKATLWLKDTISGAESTDQIVIDFTKPDASKMMITSGENCPFDGANSIYQFEFDFNTGGQSYFAVNFDTLGNGANAFYPYYTLQAPPKPGQPIPFSYAQYGSLGTQFVKGYSSGEIGDARRRSPEGSITMGLIVGNGLAITGQPATCMDTAWYADILRFSYLDSEFDIVSPSTDKKLICAGDDAYFQINNPLQNNISTLKWSWGYTTNNNGDPVGRGFKHSIYIEEFKYLEKYTGPSSGRNDKDIEYKGEDWYYNYIVRYRQDNILGTQLIDTIVTSIIKDWRIESLVDPQMIMLFDRAVNYTEIKEKEYYKLFGDGTNGCIDTTGLSEYISLEKIPYRTYNGDKVWMHGDRRYRYTNASKTDSIEVAHVLHFRDSSLQGYDTLVVGTDTTVGIWKNTYVYPKIENGDTTYHAANGPMTPQLVLQNTSGCADQSIKYLNVGFYNKFWIDDNTTCKWRTLLIEDSARYYQYGIQDLWNYPTNSRNYWYDFDRITNNLEYYETDWDSTDGIWDGTRTSHLYHNYPQAKDYVVTIVAKDSMNCRDTSYLNIRITDAEPNFGYTYRNINCQSIVEFWDSTATIGAADHIIKWQWDFGDGTRKSILHHPTHAYTQGGYFEVKLKIWTEQGCHDSINKTIYIPGPQPEFEFYPVDWLLQDTAIICLHDSIKLINISKGDINTPSFSMNWGDGNYSTPASIDHIYGHAYDTPGTYELYLTMEDGPPGAVRCSRIYPNTNPNLIVRHKIIVIVNDRPSVSITAKTNPTYAGHPTEYTAHLDPDYIRITWQMGDPDNTEINVADAIDNKIVFQYQEEGIYNLILAPEYDKLPRCPDTAMLQVIVKHDSLNSIDYLEKQISVYPNPAIDEITVRLPERLVSPHISIHTVEGRLMETWNNAKGYNIRVSVNNLPNGNYILKISTNKGLISKKITVFRE